MAQQTVTYLVDDLTGEDIDEGGETVAFGLDGQTYEIDLTAENAAQLRDDLSRYINVGRRVGASGRRARSSRATARADTGVDTRAVREWAQANGVKVSPRGRVSADVVRQYREAGN